MVNPFSKLFLPLALILAGAASPALAKWREASTNHFIIYSEQSPKELEEFAARLERYDKTMRVMRGLPDEPVSRANRVTVFMVPTLANVQRLAGGGGVAGFYVARAGGSVAVMPRYAGATSRFDLNAQTILLHEYAHHFMHQNFPLALPIWFTEGFAEFYGTARLEKDGGVSIGLPATHRGSSLMRGYPMTMEEMMGLKVGQKIDGEKFEAIYGRGWLLIHYLTFERTRKGQLQDYLVRLNRGEKSLEAARAAFGDLDQLNRDVNAYLGRGKIDMLTFPAAVVPIGKVEIRELSPGEEAVMDIRIRSRVGVTPGQARALLPQARAAAMPFPADEQAQTALAEAAFDARNYAEAEAAADRAITVNPRSIDGLLYKAMARMEAAKAAKATDEATWKEVRTWLLAANRADPAHPRPPILYYESFEGQGLAPTANAVAGLVRALELAPHDDDLRLQVARRHLVDGRGNEARATLAPIAFSPHGGKRAEKVNAVLEKLESGGAKQALETWDSLDKKDKEAADAKKKS